ncbi:MAG: hypothetical protein KJ799_03790 [Bacteroidetes bacterium]|nr:hypothetical protein [Bacteroidota bacterium]MBU2505830.1 hypothetical protein [Bacteroidota bacterium]
MPKVINAENLIQQKEKLPTEAFFVDTNTIVYLNDPFGESESDGLVTELNPKLSRLYNYLANHHKCYCTIEIAFEYYHHIKYGTMKNFKKLRNNIEYSDFKKLRKTDTEFHDIWNQRIRKFKRAFEKRFVLYNSHVDLEKLIISYKSENDFVDHLFYSSVISLPDQFRCILTYDEDFYNYAEDFYLLTFNPKIISLAKRDDKLYM